jgi:hypothetical protein
MNVEEPQWYHRVSCARNIEDPGDKIIFKAHSNF